MSPNLLVLVKKAIAPWTWQSQPDKTPQLHFSQDPVPGVYAITHDNQCFLVAVKPNGKKDAEGLFRKNPKEDSQFHLAKKLGKKATIINTNNTNDNTNGKSTTQSFQDSAVELPTSPFSDAYANSCTGASSISSNSASSYQRSGATAPNLVTFSSSRQSSIRFGEPLRSKDIDNTKSQSTASSVVYHDRVPTLKLPVRPNTMRTKSPYQTPSSSTGGAHFLESFSRSTAFTISTTFLPQKPSLINNNDAIDPVTRVYPKPQGQPRIQIVEPLVKQEAKRPLFTQNTTLPLYTYLAHPKPQPQLGTLAAIDFPGYKFLARPLQTTFSAPHNRHLFADELAAMTTFRDACPAFNISRSHISWYAGALSSLPNKWVLLDDGFSYVPVDEVVTWRPVVARKVGKRGRSVLCCVKRGEKKGTEEEVLFLPQHGADFMRPQSDQETAVRRDLIKKKLWMERVKNEKGEEDWRRLVRYLAK
ncbi:hypothetical protein G7Y89_g4289 [Cudoniella acicularis]|uniref:Uncharacterized protein n=1 Tax=Cudoniella acicularis TaxID=354080 RepID=A0A8H4RPS6_9HELO|nr:hypothetical protein G7Y89_g4289 [Cudoniella acicularis]